MQAERERRPVLNPFAFPSETKGRFSMLILAALVCGASLGSLFHIFLLGNYGSPVLYVEFRQEIQRWWGKKIIDANTHDIISLAHQQVEIIRSALLFYAKVLALPSLFTLLMGALAAYFYANHARRLRLRYKTRLLTRADAPKLVADLERCAERFGLHLPRLEYSPGLAQGHAFGPKGDEVLLLHGTPAILESSWGDANRAIALHELAHIANADAQEREKASAVWKSFLVVLTGCMVVLGLFGLRLSGAGLLRVLSILIFLRALWAGLIRTREFYADWRAVSWGAGPALKNLLELKEGEGGPWENWNWWWKSWERWGDKGWWLPMWLALSWAWSRLRWILRLHPSFRTRREVLNDANRLFRITPDLPLLTGILMSLAVSASLLLTFCVLMAGGGFVGLIHSAALGLLSNLSPGPFREFLLAGSMLIMELLLLALMTGAILVPSYFVTRTIGVQLQRNAAAHMALGNGKNWGYGNLLSVAFLLALGTEAGLHIAPFTPIVFTRSESWAALPIWLMGFTLLLWLWLAYVHGISRMLLGSHTGIAVPRTRQILIALSSTLLLVVLYWPALLARVTLQVMPMMHDNGRLPFNLNPRRVFVYGFFVTALMALILALFAYFVWVLLSMAALRWGPLRRRQRCPTCGEEVLYMLSLGRTCRGCGKVLGSWIFLPESTAVANTETSNP